MKKKTATRKKAISPRLVSYRKNGKTYEAYEVGWTDPETRVRKKKRFKTEAEARTFAGMKSIESTNVRNATTPILTTLADSEVREAESAKQRLGDRYSLTKAVDFFLNHYAAPDSSIELRNAITEFLGDKEGTLRERSIRQLKSVLTAFSKRIGPETPLHEITKEDCERFLGKIKAKDGGAASKKTWNNYRGDLHCFFAWASESGRKYAAENPVSEIVKHRKTNRGLPGVLTLSQCEELLHFVATGEVSDSRREEAEKDEKRASFLKAYKPGRLARYFALAIFTGIRTGPDGELYKLAAHPDRERLIDLGNKVIHIEPEISKTGHYRQIKIRDNLLKWLNRFPGEIFPSNFDRDVKGIRREFGLGHDVLRHTFISMHVAAFRSIGDAALEAGNTEQIVKLHYLNLRGQRDGKAFWKITPPGKGQSKVVAFA